MGRPAHDIWALFHVVGERGVDKPHPDVECVYCNTRLTNAQPSRNMLRHVVQCGSIFDELKTKWRAIDGVKKQARVEARKLRTPPHRAGRGVEGSTPGVNKRLFGTPRPSSTTKKSPSTLKKPTDEENYLRVATGLYATGIPFRCVDDIFFKKMFDYKLPSRHQLAGRLFDAVYNREKKKAIQDLSGARNLALVTDGWSNPNNESIINFVLTNLSVLPVFWKSMSMRDAVHTVNFIAQCISDVIKEVHEVIQDGIVALVVTDNASNMTSAWTILQQEYRGLICGGCSTHGMNLLMKDIFELDFFSEILKKANTLAKFVKTRYALLDRFRELQKQLKKKKESRRALSIPVPTRWYSCEWCIQSVLKNKDVIAATFSDTELMSRYQDSRNSLEETTAILRDEDFWRQADNVLRMVQPINQSLAAFERDNCCVSVAYQQFEWFLMHEAYTARNPHLNVNVQRVLLEIIEERHQFVWDDVVTIAHLLDQRRIMTDFIEGDLIDTIHCASRMAKRLDLLSDLAAVEFHKQLVAFVIWKRS